MTPDKIIVIIGGVAGILFVAWFFFGKKEEAVIADEKIDIEVSGGYKPSVIELKKGRKTTLNFSRTDSNSCLEEVILPDFKIKKFLPLNQKTPIEIIPEKSGEFEISCGMNMFHGRIIVRD